MKILECSSKGDRRYSAFYANVMIFGAMNSIESHYQLSKRFLDERPLTWKDAKGKQPTHFSIKGHDFDLKYLGQWYKLLWLKYLDSHPELVSYAKQFDEFSDMFRGNSQNCQSDVIRQYVKQGRDSIIRDCHEFLAQIRNAGVLRST